MGKFYAVSRSRADVMYGRIVYWFSLEIKMAEKCKMEICCVQLRAVIVLAQS